MTYPTLVGRLGTGVALLAVSTVVRVALPTSYNPENFAVVLLTYLGYMAFWLGMLFLAAFMLASVMNERRPSDPGRSAQVATALARHPLLWGSSLLALSALLRVLFAGGPGPVSRVYLLTSQLEWTSFWLGLLCVAGFLVAGLLQERADDNARA